MRLTSEESSEGVRAWGLCWDTASDHCVFRHSMHPHQLTQMPCSYKVYAPLSLTASVPRARPHQRKAPMTSPTVSSSSRTALIFSSRPFDFFPPALTLDSSLSFLWGRLSLLPIGQVYWLDLAIAILRGHMGSQSAGTSSVLIPTALSCCRCTDNAAFTYLPTLQAGRAVRIGRSRWPGSFVVGNPNRSPGLG